MKLRSVGFSSSPLNIRETLIRSGLLELEIKDDISKLKGGINKIVPYINHVNSTKKVDLRR